MMIHKFVSIEETVDAPLPQGILSCRTSDFMKACAVTQEFPETLTEFRCVTCFDQKTCGVRLNLLVDACNIKTQHGRTARHRLLNDARVILTKRRKDEQIGGGQILCKFVAVVDVSQPAYIVLR